MANTGFQVKCQNKNSGLFFGTFQDLIYQKKSASTFTPFRKLIPKQDAVKLHATALLSMMTNTNLRLLLH